MNTVTVETTDFFLFCTALEGDEAKALNALEELLTALEEGTVSRGTYCPHKKKTVVCISAY